MTLDTILTHVKKDIKWTHFINKNRIEQSRTTNHSTKYFVEEDFCKDNARYIGCLNYIYLKVESGYKLGKDIICIPSSTSSTPKQQVQTTNICPDIIVDNELLQVQWDVLDVIILFEQNRKVITVLIVLKDTLFVFNASLVTWQNANFVLTLITKTAEKKWSHLNCHLLWFKLSKTK